ncbi:MAG: alkaline shock response membrane anchor protein AmaP [Clostridia bacterium]|nr:alkaline shock response membrane anchor protein AmaP [Clostridia bacterium]
MKILEKFVLILYSFLMLIVSAIICLIVFKVITIDQIKYTIEYVQKDTALVITILAIAIVCILLSIRCLFFRKKKQIKKSNTTEILLENESGRLLISKNAIENAAKNIVKESLRLDTDIKVTADIDPANNISIYIAVMLDRALNVRDLTLDLQLRIKNEIKESFGLEVKQVNIKVDSDEKEIDKLEKANEKKEAKIEAAAKKEEAKLEAAKKEAENVIEVSNNDNGMENKEGNVTNISNQVEEDNNTNNSEVNS